MLTVFMSAVMAGLWIGVGGSVFLAVGGVEGAVLFAVALITVVHYRYLLYTGVAGFIDQLPRVTHVGVIIAGNVLGTLFMAGVAATMGMNSDEIIGSRMQLALEDTFVRAIMCGLIMSAAVSFGKKQQWLPLLFGVPVFILCGYLHSIADAFYLLLFVLNYCTFDLSLVLYWVVVVVGNFVGCNLWRSV